jgi:phage protein D
MGFIPALTFLRGNWQMIAGVSGWALLFAMTSMYLNKRDDFAAETERCRVERLESILEFDREMQRAAKRAAQAHLAELDKMAQAVAAAEKEVMQIRLTSREAEIRVEHIVKEVADATPESCLNVRVDDRVVRSLRQRKDRHPPGSRGRGPD